LVLRPTMIMPTLGQRYQSRAMQVFFSDQSLGLDCSILHRKRMVDQLAELRARTNRFRFIIARKSGNENRRTVPIFQLLLQKYWLATRTTGWDLSILTQRACRLSCAQPTGNGPLWIRAPPRPSCQPQDTSDSRTPNPVRPMSKTRDIRLPPPPTHS